MRKEDLRNRGLVRLLKETDYDSSSLSSAIEISMLDARTERQLVGLLKETVDTFAQPIEAARYCPGSSAYCGARRLRLDSL